MRITCCFIILIWMSSCGSRTKNDSEKMTLFVAASLTNVMTELVDSFAAGKTIQVRTNFASSGTLARQINQGADCDLYISANKKWMDYVERKDKVVDSTRVAVIGNSLVLICPKEIESSLSTLEQLPEVLQGRLSIGDNNHVPAGKYAVEALQNIGILDDIKDKILPAKDVRNALMNVELGECRYGIVYKTDALKSDKVKVILNISDTLHSSIKYHSALINTKKSKEITTEFINYLIGEKGKELWFKHGFSIQ